ncbi:hypothetical protein IAG44_21935 [Streptomyces roseirectus]|uniref:Uncharacterized protein n=1 Tax=Streptomyces roseirectus TaxID=2768066 RepID=A0A7H0IG97_9ACTN|nr:hypothetical protein [Streptomyces roseirectus]QNP71813.1 hypothetical protein IAG44_21935 [Streptomyces roseirectus]
MPLLLVGFAVLAFFSNDTDIAGAWRDAAEAHRRYTAQMAGLANAEPLSPGFFYDDPRYQMAKASFVDLRSVCTALAVAALVLGVFSGSRDWATRVMLTLTAAEPRRVRFFVVRGGLVAAVSAGVTVLSAVLLVPLLLVVARFRGSLEGTDVHFWGVLAVIVLRGAAFVGLTGLLGYGLGMLLRHPGQALGLALAYLVAAGALLQDYLPSLAEFHLSGIAFAVLDERLLMATEKTDCTGDLACLAMREGTPAGVAFLGLACYVVPVVAVAVWRFVRRDVG